MASQTLTLSVLPRGKPIKTLPEEAALPRGAPASDIYRTVAAKSGVSIHRIRVTKASDGQLVPNDKDVPIQQTGLLDGSKIYVKDLGMHRGRSSWNCIANSRQVRKSPGKRCSSSSTWAHSSSILYSMFFAHTSILLHRELAFHHRRLYKRCRYC
jgi:hypothetical protein